MILLAFVIVATHSHRDTLSEIQHSGGTDSYGCHNDNVHGGYHCHNPK